MNAKSSPYLLLMQVCLVLLVTGLVLPQAANSKAGKATPGQVIYLNKGKAAYREGEAASEKGRSFAAGSPFYRAAVEHFSRGLSLPAGGSAKVYLLTGRALALFRLAKMQESKRDAEAAHRLGPRWGWPMFITAKVLLSQHDFNGALLWTSKAISADPRWSEPRTLMAETYEAMGLPDKALATAEKAVEINPKDIAARLALLRAQMALHKYTQSLSTCNNNISLFPQALVHFLPLRAEIEVALLRYREADKDLEVILTEMPNNVSYRVNRAKCCMRLRKFKDVIEQCSIALKLDPQCLTAYLVRAGAQLELGDPSSALQDLITLGRLQKPNLGGSLSKAYALRGRAQLYTTLGKPREALADLETAVKLVPNDVNMYLVYSDHCISELQDYKSAEAWLSNGISIKPDNAHLLYERARIRGYVNNIPGALADLDKAITLEPSIRAYSRYREKLLSQQH